MVVVDGEDEGVDEGVELGVEEGAFWKLVGVKAIVFGVVSAGLATLTV